MFLIGSDTFVVAPLMPSLAKAFDVSTTQSGWLVSVYAIGYALTGLVSGQWRHQWRDDEGVRADQEHDREPE